MCVGRALLFQVACVYVSAPRRSQERKKENEERERERERRERRSGKKRKGKKKNFHTTANFFNLLHRALPRLSPSASLSPPRPFRNDRKMTVAGITVVGPRIAAAVLLSTAAFVLVPQMTHSEAPPTTGRYAADGVHRARHPLQSTDRTGELGFFPSFLFQIYLQSGGKEVLSRGRGAGPSFCHHLGRRSRRLKQFRRLPKNVALACFVPDHLRSRKLC